MSFIPLIRDNNNIISTEASLKYFLTQALASAVLLFAIILHLLENNLLININDNYSSIIIISSLLLKRGTAPFHFWFPNVIEGLSWINALILITWQKIAPLILISYLNIKSIILICAIISVTVGSLGGLNQTSLRKLISFSSINHLGWILSAIYTREILWLIYFLFYSFLSFRLIFIFNNFKLYHINQLFSLFFKSKTIKFTIILNLLSLGGLPPFLGFLPKWIVIQSVTINRQLLLIVVLTVITLITLYFYLRLCYSAFILNYYELNINYFIMYKLNSINRYLLISYISIFGLPIISIVYFIL